MRMNPMNDPSSNEYKFDFFAKSLRDGVAMEDYDKARSSIDSMRTYAPKERRAEIDTLEHAVQVHFGRRQVQADFNADMFRSDAGPEMLSICVAAFSAKIENYERVAAKYELPLKFSLAFEFPCADPECPSKR